MSSKFKPGRSGNPAGKPKGRENSATTLARRALQEASPEILAKLIENAKAGDPTALKILAPRLLPTQRAIAPIELPDTSTPEGGAEALVQLVAMVAEGSMGHYEARSIASMIETSAAFYQGALKFSEMYRVIVEVVCDSDPEVQRRVINGLKLLSNTIGQTDSKFLNRA